MSTIISNIMTNTRSGVQLTNCQLTGSGSAQHLRSDILGSEVVLSVFSGHVHPWETYFLQVTRIKGLRVLKLNQETEMLCFVVEEET